MLGNAVPWAILHTTVFTPPGIWQVNGGSKPFLFFFGLSYIDYVDFLK